VVAVEAIPVDARHQGEVDRAALIRRLDGLSH
jgi:hypothetical protein